MNEENIKEWIQTDRWMMEVLHTAKRLDLPDWWICAGFVRSKVWDVMHGFSERTPISDIDVIYFDDMNLNEAEEKDYEKKLNSYMPNIPWSVKNEARMHLRNNLPPYRSSVDAISKFPETATAIGVKIDDEDEIILTAPHGIEDLVELKIKPTPFFAESEERLAIYQKRIEQKNWKRTWKNLIEIAGICR